MFMSMCLYTSRETMFARVWWVAGGGSVIMIVVFTYLSFFMRFCIFSLLEKMSLV